VNDKELLDQIADHKESAMEVFYKKYSGIVYAFAFKTLHNPVDANEIVNEVMMEVWKKAHTFAGKSTIKTWLLSITHHKSVDLVRKNVRHDHEDESHIDEQSPDNISCSLLDLEVASENNAHVKTCVNELANGHRQVVHLTFFEGLSYPEISTILEIPQGTVKTRMLHAKKQLLACISRFLSRD